MVKHVVKGPCSREFARGEGAETFGFARGYGLSDFSGGRGVLHALKAGRISGLIFLNRARCHAEGKPDIGAAESLYTIFPEIAMIIWESFAG